ncbi:amidohydrolase [Aureibaculum sp. 2210JD6-5]|uniref:amidohydrolase n=1 Tax=Aureibaculum sp. 2210JD6-5 TaxID=3103957 RepID=UPI002AAE8942|nr:amidohydrolase [Aureibaculum sp. 2210JD6-5]MDY7394803.1 amidohydrolase [Aureibaculum sp. 2210JD6-5]
MKKIILLFFALLIFISCTEQEKADLIIFNANIYTVNDSFAKAEAIAIKNGKFIAVGTTAEIIKKYEAANNIDVDGKTIVPGLIDAHCHFYGLGLSEQKVKLEGTKSFDEVVQRIVDFQKEKNVSYITGRGWDQNDWEVKEFPTKDKLDELFPETPIAITRIDGHALLANQAAIDLAGVTVDTPFSGGDIIKKDGKLTGVFVDNPMGLIGSKIPGPSLQESIQALKDAEKICLANGLTTVNDAGLSREAIELIDSLQQAGQLKIKVYAMASAYPKNLDYYLNKGTYKTDRLNVRSFKVYGDGALGSRGAALREPYSDKPGHFGALVNTPENLKEIAERIADSDFQMNTHAIGDSANHYLLEIYEEVLKDKTDRRWKIEHAQIVSPDDFDFFKNIVPSIQPTHATSDMYWAKDRVGAERMKGAYAFKDLLNQYGKVALGTDFPVEHVSPMLTFYAAVARKDLNNYPKNGFQMENALSKEETLKGMTIWAAYSNFEENEKGSIEVGKMADFIILDQNIMEIPVEKVPNIKVLDTYVNGEKLN